MADPLATIATYWSLEDCAVHRTALDAAAIRNFADDFFIVNIDWLYANMARGIKLRVPVEDLDAAADVLEGATEVGEPEPFEEAVESCEACSSTAIEPAPKWLAFLGFSAVFMGAAISVGQAAPGLFVVLAAFLIALMAPRRRCTECEERW